LQFEYDGRHILGQIERGEILSQLLLHNLGNSECCGQSLPYQRL
jgi:hypothetical protein